MFKQQFISLLLVLGTNSILWSQGVIFNDSTYKLLPSMARTKRAQVVLDNQASIKKYAPQAGNQGQNSTCLAWAIAYALTIQEAKLRQDTLPEKIQKLFYSPAFIYHHIKESQDNDCKGGAAFEQAVHAVQASGLLRYTDLEGDCVLTLSEDLKAKAFKSIVPNFPRLMEPNVPKLMKVKKALMNGNPVIIAIKSAQADQPLGHALCVVGYNDKRPNGGAIEVLNSLGTTHGTKGYEWITYAEFEKRVYYAIEVPPLLELPKTMVADAPATRPNAPVNPPKTPTRPLTVPAAVPATPVQEILFSSKVQLLNARNQPMKLKRLSQDATRGTKTANGHFMALDTVRKDFEYQILIDNNEQAYVYVLNYDSRKVVDTLFPQDNVDPYLSKGSAITLPSDDYPIAFDDNKGNDYCCILFSRRPLDMKKMKIDIEAEGQKQTKENFALCLENVLKEKLALTLSNSVKYNAGDGTLNLTMKSESSIAAMIIQFIHQ